jgi:acyl-CoA dehydrogenase
MSVVWILALVLGIAVLAHYRLRAPLILGAVAIFLVLMALADQVPVWLQVIFWLLLVAAALPILLPDLRRRFFTARLYAWFGRVLPPMSDTEREAIDAGSVWWDGQLFSGRPDWDVLLDYPPAVLTAEEQAFLDGPTEQLCASGPAAGSLGVYQGQRLLRPDHSQAVRRQGLLRLCPFADRDETGDP